MTKTNQFNEAEQIKTKIEDLNIEMNFDASMPQDTVVSREYFDYRIAVALALDNVDQDLINNGDSVNESDYCKYIRELFPKDMIIMSNTPPKVPGVQWKQITVDQNLLQKGEALVSNYLNNQNKLETEAKVTDGTMPEHNHAVFQENEDLDLTDNSISTSSNYAQIVNTKTKKLGSILLEKVGLNKKNLASGYMTNFWIVVANDTEQGCNITKPPSLKEEVDFDSSECRPNPIPSEPVIPEEGFPVDPETTEHCRPNIEEEKPETKRKVSFFNKRGKK